MEDDTDSQGILNAPEDVYDDSIELDIPSLAELLAPTVSKKAVDLSTPSSSSYLAHLSSLPLDSLLAEPALISHESSSVEAELTNLCYREYGTFISIHECSSAVTDAFDDFSTSLDSLLASVPDLESECRSFADSTFAIQKERRKASVVQEHQEKLVDVLEIPRLMDTCVRNGYYAEALELEAHARDLRERYGEIPLIQDVANQVERVRQLMLAQLLALLREPVKLPTLVKAVNFLRKMDMSDSLPLTFLLSRQHNLHTQLVSIEKDKTDPTRYIKRYVDIFREHVYDIISQYSAIFLDTSSAIPKQTDVDHLTTFAQAQVEGLLSVLQTMVPNINEPASLSSILIQLGYCSLSFARVGLDFSHLVVEPFESAVEKTFSDGCAAAAADFATIFKAAIRNGATPTEILMLPDHMPELDALQSGETQITQPPPLASYPPIATLLNGHITALNALRLLAPLSLHRRLAEIQKASLAASSKTLLQYIQLSTSDHTPLPPVSLSRSNSQTKHSRNPSASLRRRATNYGPGQSQAQMKVSVAALKAFKVAADWLVRGLDLGIYKAGADVDGVIGEGAVAVEVEEWLKAMDPKPMVSALEMKAFVDEPLAMTAGESSGTTEVAKAVSPEQSLPESDLGAQPSVDKTRPAFEATTVSDTTLLPADTPTDAMPPMSSANGAEAAHDSTPLPNALAQASEVRSVDASTTENTSAQDAHETAPASVHEEDHSSKADEILVLAPTETPETVEAPHEMSHSAVDSVRDEHSSFALDKSVSAEPDAQPIAATEVTADFGDDAQTEGGKGAVKEPETAMVEEDPADTAELEPVVLADSAPATVDAEVAASTGAPATDDVPSEVELGAAATGSDRAAVSVDKVEQTLLEAPGPTQEAHAEPSEPLVIPKVDMASLFEPAAAATSQDPDLVLTESIPIVEPTSIEAAETTAPEAGVEAEEVERPAPLVIEAEDGPAPSTQPPMVQDEARSSTEASASTASPRNEDDAAVSASLADRKPSSDQLQTEPSTIIDQSSSAAVTTAASSEAMPEAVGGAANETTIEPATSPMAKSDQPAKSAIQDPSQTPDPTTPSPSNPVSEPALTNPSRAPSPDNVGPVKTSGGGKKKNKKKGKKK